VSKKELIARLKSVLQAAVDAETPTPQPPPPPATPAEGHRLHLRAGRFGCEFCCDDHAEAFERNVQRYAAPQRATEALLGPAQRYIGQRLGPHRGYGPGR
jgi:hypothetical protein